MRQGSIALVLFASLTLAAAARAEDSAPADKPADTQAARPARKPGKKHVHSKDCGCPEAGRAWLKAHPEAVSAVPGAQPASPQVARAGPVAVAASEALATAAAPRSAVPAVALPNSERPTAAPPAASDKMFGEPARSDGRLADSVYKLDPAIDTAVIAVGAAGSIGPWLLQDRIIRPKGLGDPSTLNSWDASVVGNHSASLALTSNATTLAALALPVAIDLADVGWTSTLFEDGVVMTEVLAMTGMGVSYAKYTFQRRSPALYLAGNTAAANDTSQYRSFVSWQTATTFASLSALSYTLGARHDLGVLPWLGTLVVGGSVAAERVASGGAFYTDVIAGAAIGIAAGTVVPWLHERSGFDVSVAPSPGGMSIGGTRRF